MIDIFTGKGDMGQFQIPEHSTGFVAQGAGVRSPYVLWISGIREPGTGMSPLTATPLLDSYILRAFYLPTNLNSRKMASSHSIFSVTQVFPIDKIQIALRIGVSKKCVLFWLLVF